MTLTIIAWILIVVLFIVGMAGAVYPVLPGVLAVYAAFFVYGLMISWSDFGFWFWFIETTIVVVVFVADYALGAWGVKRFGGTRASVIGSTLGIILGPFVIPVAGLLIGPFLGAVIGELIAGKDARSAMMAGWGALVGFFTSTAAKIILQLIMIVVFIIAWLW
ncbi:DUF456 domain-containing protein [Gorillibacterium sp. sgz5001074]|uniref:DUF456 domain-containing protein n=1 Tax=Gorillibacterium sp. sgz5001074 TaxID=3446695 RepID=UPI003F662C99